MKDLKDSRNRFMNRYELARDTSFWLQWAEAVGSEEALNATSDPQLKVYKPDHANCPELEILMKELAESVPDRWRARVQNTFVGRVLGAEPNASAWQRSNSRVVELELQFTNVLAAYADAFARFVDAMRGVTAALARGEDEVRRVASSLHASNIAAVWSGLDLQRNDWIDPNRIHGVARLESDSPFVNDNGIAVAVSAAERFIVSHELAHHILAHTSSARVKPEDLALLNRLLDEYQLDSVVDKLSTSERDECFADLLGFHIAAECLGRSADPRTLYRAILGAMLALVAVAHTSADWFSSEDGVHPAFLVRYEVIHAAATHAAARTPGVGTWDSPFDLLSQLAGFVSGAVQWRLHRTDPSLFPEPSLLNTTLRFLDQRLLILDRQKPDAEL